jgi:hypothetical protein
MQGLNLASHKSDLNSKGPKTVSSYLTSLNSKGENATAGIRAAKAKIAWRWREESGIVDMASDASLNFKPTR